MAGRPSTTNGRDLIEWAVKHVGDRDPVRGYVLAIEQEARDDALRDAAERVARLPANPTLDESNPACEVAVEEFRAAAVAATHAPWRDASPAEWDAARTAALQPEAQPAGAVAEGVAIMERGIDPTTDPDEIARRKAAMDAAPFFPAQPAGAPEPDPLALFVAAASEVMLARMRHGAAKFGAESWRDEYWNEDNLERLRRAVDHLEAARSAVDDPDEWAKRAADVANQAFMFADPRRHENAPPAPIVRGAFDPANGGW